MADGTKRTGAIAWLVALVVPPAVAGGLGQSFVAHHATGAVVIGLAYEAIIAIGGFFAVVARDVSSRWQARLADRIDLFLQRKGPRFERRYRQFMLDGLKFTDTKGLATVGPFTPEHDAIFVDVSLVPRPPQHITSGILPHLADERTGRRALGYFLGRAEQVVLAVVGGPGSGKTTLLRHAARQASMRRRSGRERVRDIPVLLYLRDHAARIVAEPAVTVGTLLRTTLGSVSADEPPGWFEQQLKDGRCLVLLDGLDEVAQRDDRVKVSAWAEAQVRQYPRSSFVISSRPQGYQSAPVEGAEIVQVCGFTIRQVEAFVRGWYRAVERHSTGTAGPEVEALAAEGAADLLHSLEQTPALYDLTVNPLLLTMIANVHRYRGALPGSRADLYAEICLVMLGRRQEAKRLVQQVSGDKKEVILRGLAYTMMERRLADMSRDDVLTEIKPALRRVARDVTPDDFLADVSSNGLLIERETGQCAFSHKTVQEYLAAAHIRDKGLVSVLVDAVNDDWWAETTLLYAAKSNADLIVQACLDAGTPPALALALECVGQDSDVDPDLRERMEDLVFLETDPEDRRLFGGILLRLHMRHRVPTRGETQVCPHPISNDIYGLFLADTATPKPDAPTGLTGIAVGMRGSDAIAFTQWAKAVSGGQQAYRLPLLAELDELAAQQRIMPLPSGRPPRIWTQAHRASTGTLPTLWLPPGDSFSSEFESASLVRAVELDLTTSASTLNRLLLLRARVLALALDHALALNLDLVRPFARVRALISDLQLACAQNRDVRLDHALALDGARVSILALPHDPERDRMLATALAADIAGARARIPALHGILDRAMDLAHALVAADFDRAIDAANDLEERLSHLLGGIEPLLDAACGSVLGDLLSLPSGVLKSGSRADFLARVAEELSISGRVRASEQLSVDLGALEGTLVKAVQQLTAELNGRSFLLGVPSWGPIVAERLLQNARSVLDRREQPTPEKATAIRLAALCLAGEADGMERTDIGDMFRQVAEGITLLQRRATDARYAPEVILLAME